MNRKCIFLMAFLICLLTGCKSNKQTAANEEAQGYYFTDALDNQIRVHDSKRVVALMGSFGEIWLNAGGELIGVTDDALEERGLDLSEDTVTVGTYNNPNLETIMDLSPDLILLSAETKEHVALENIFKETKIPAAYFRVTYFEDYLKMLKICTEITGQKEKYEENGLKVQEQIERIISERAGSPSPEILLLITYSGGAVVQDSQTMTGRMLKDLGCKNIADEKPGLLKEFSMEYILEADPDYIFVISMGNSEELADKNRKETIEENPAWNGLTAVKQGRYILLPKEGFLYKPNARWGESYAYLSDILKK